MLSEEHIKALTGLLGERSVLAGDAIGERHHVDWGGENACPPAVLLRPVDTPALSAALAYCHEHQLSVVTQGGMTGLCGGATPQPGEVALSLERLNGIIQLDADAMTVTVRAGTPLQVIQQAAAEAGLRFPLDLGARGSCQIGGNVATNAGGNQVIRFGTARALVLGLEAVLADGTVIRAMNQMLKNNAGYDLKQLFIGSEGTLGVITELVLRLFPARSQPATALCAVPDFQSAIRLLRTVQAELPSVTTFELMWGRYVETVCQRNAMRPPFDDSYPFYVLLETETAPLEQVESVLGEQLEKGVMQDALIAQSGQDTEDFWAIRDGIAHLLAELESFANFDVGLPLSDMQAFSERVDAALQADFPGIINLMFGHIADGNLHLIAWTGRQEDVQLIYERVYALVAEFDGTITAEHGIGVSKRKYLHNCRSEAEIALMKTLKQALDPRGILNPGRVL